MKSPTCLFLLMLLLIVNYSCLSARNKASGNPITVLRDYKNEFSNGPVFKIQPKATYSWTNGELSFSWDSTRQDEAFMNAFIRSADSVHYNFNHCHCLLKRDTTSIFFSSHNPDFDGELIMVRIIRGRFSTVYYPRQKFSVTEQELMVRELPSHLDQNLTGAIKLRAKFQTKEKKQGAYTFAGPFQCTLDTAAPYWITEQWSYFESLTVGRK